MKHRNTIRLRALLAALVLCLGLLAGCGSASRPDDAAEETFQSAAAPEGSAPESDESDHQADADDAPAEDSSADGTPISALPEDFPSPAAPGPGGRSSPSSPTALSLGSTPIGTAAAIPANIRRGFTTSAASAEPFPTCASWTRPPMS